MNIHSYYITFVFMIALSLAIAQPTTLPANPAPQQAANPAPVQPAENATPAPPVANPAPVQPAENAATTQPAPIPADPFLSAMPTSNREQYDSNYSSATTYLEWQNHQLARQLVQQIRQRGWVVVTAESVSGGELVKSLVRCPGAGSCVVGGAVCYHLEAKRQLLGVSDTKDDDLYDHQTAREMAVGARNLYQVSETARATADASYSQKPIMAIATTGRAVTYPGHFEGGTHIALALPDGQVISWYAKHEFIAPLSQPDSARTKHEGMLLATHHALRLVLEHFKTTTRNK